MTVVAERRSAALMVLPLVDALDEIDSDADALLLAHGLDRQRIRDTALRLPAESVVSLFRDAEAMSGDPTIGVRAGLSLRAGALDVYGYAVQSAATLAEAWVSGERFAPLVSDRYKRNLRLEGDRAVVEYVREPLETDVYVEFVLTALGGIARRMTGQLLTPLRITMRRAPSSAEDGARFAALLGIEPELGATSDAIEFPTAYLTLPLAAADAGLHKILERHAEELLARLPKVQTLSSQAREVILGELRGGNPGLANIAEKLGTTARTLQRRLAEEGTTHQAVLDGLRMTLADRYLKEQSLPIYQVALLLGFSSASAFHAAFRRWYGTTPERHRSGALG